jgi:hypothetical protein
VVVLTAVQVEVLHLAVHQAALQEVHLVVLVHHQEDHQAAHHQVEVLDLAEVEDNLKIL